MPLNPDFYPMVVKITKTNFWGMFGLKGLKMGSDSGRLESPESLKKLLGKIGFHSVIDF